MQLTRFLFLSIYFSCFGFDYNCFVVVGLVCLSEDFLFLPHHYKEEQSNNIYCILITAKHKKANIKNTIK